MASEFKLLDFSDLLGKPFEEVVADLRKRILAAADEPRFPCQSEPMKDPPPRLLHLLYRLLRDEVVAGYIDEILLEGGKPAEHEYSNPHLEALARAYCTQLVGGEQEAMDRAGDVLETLRIRLEKAGVWDEQTQGIAALDKLIEQAKVTDQLILDIGAWLRGDEAERVRAAAIADDIPPEDVLADAVERRFGSRRTRADGR